MGKKKQPSPPETLLGQNKAIHLALYHLLYRATTAEEATWLSYSSIDSVPPIKADVNRRFAQFDQSRTPATFRIYSSPPRGWGSER
jgi:hypothetical protein